MTPSTISGIAELNEWMVTSMTAAFGDNQRYWAWREGLDAMLQECGAEQTGRWGWSSRADAQYLVQHGIEPDRIKTMYALCFL